MTGEAAAAPAPHQANAQYLLRVRINQLDGVADARELALRFAALSGRFDALDALAMAGIGAPAADAPDDALLRRVAVVAALSDACDTKVWKPQWIMRATERARVLAEAGDARAKLIAWRAKGPGYDDVARDIADAALGRGDFAPAAVDWLLARERPEAAALDRALRGLVLAGACAPAADRESAVRACLARATADGDDALLDHGMVGREAEIAWLVAGVERQWGPTPVSPPRFAYVEGIGGIGKSTLLAELKRRAIEDHRAIVATLDFDRPGIEGGDPLGLSLDLARQAAAAAGAAGAGLYADRVSNAGQAGASDDGAGREAQALALSIGGVVTSTGRPLLLLLDTLESLALRGDSAVKGLMAWLETIARALPRVAVVAAGRGAPDPLLAPHVEARRLDGLEPATAAMLLGRLGIDGAAARELVALAKGSPLLLRLGARLIREAGPEVLAQGALPPGLPERALAGQLYRLILSRLTDPLLRAIAHPGLLLRRIDAALVAEVIGPEIALGGIGAEQAERLIAQLRGYAWLVEPVEGWLVQRPELRAVLLDIQIADDPRRARRLFAAAADWFAKRPEVWARAEALYYRLMGTRWGGRLPAIDPALAPLLASDMIDDLPAGARDALALARGERSSRLRAAPARSATPTPPRAAITPAEADEVAMLIERRDFAEAGAMVLRTAGPGALDPAAPAADAVLQAWWRAGDARMAARLLKRRDRALPDARLPTQPSLAAGLIAARADLDPEGFRARIAADHGWTEGVAAFVSRAPLESADLDEAALLLRAEGVPCASELADALWTLWVGEPASPERLAALAESRLVRLAERRRDGVTGATTGGNEGGAGTDALIALLAGNATQTRTIAARLDDRRRAGGGARLDAIAAAAAALLPDAPAEARARFAGPYAADQFDAIGGLAAWATLAAALEPGLRIAAPAASAARRAGTIAGRWGYGAPPPGWRQPATDSGTAARLDALLAAPDPRAAAEAVLDGYAALMGAAPRADQRARLAKRLDPVLLRAPVALIGARAEAAAAAAQALIATGAPLLLAPALAVRLTVRSAITGPARATPITPAAGDA